jgi:hypothetical protein
VFLVYSWNAQLLLVINWIVFYGVRFFSKEQSLLSSVCQQKVNGGGASLLFWSCLLFLTSCLNFERSFFNFRLGFSYNELLSRLNTHFGHFFFFQFRHDFRSIFLRNLGSVFQITFFHVGLSFATSPLILDLVL